MHSKRKEDAPIQTRPDQTRTGTGTGTGSETVFIYLWCLLVGSCIYVALMRCDAL
eukprot:NODE_11052_length_229_cov_31.883333_g10311_i0.p2 GENE.NODE_11052_length_229_cov_31.883333_g10311_i0~~NODE_11052_length_229_cov_31.883333_g10311_i0.p2  ORF type:complete len:55 (+),score=0.54 NODE_11052_length_229_cov_31.883333_g10311_i0:24-188(+)